MSLTPAQQGDINSGRAFLRAASEGRPVLAAHLETSAEVDSFYPVALGAALAHIGELLTVIDGLTGSAS